MAAYNFTGNRGDGVSLEVQLQELGTFSQFDGELCQLTTHHAHGFQEFQIIQLRRAFLRDK